MCCFNIQNTPKDYAFIRAWGDDADRQSDLARRDEGREGQGEDIDVC